VNPVIVAFYPFKYRDVDFLMRHRQEIERLLGVQLPESDPDASFGVYREKMKKILSLVNEKCMKEKGGTTCIYKYKDNVVSEFLESPVLVACRGTVVRWYDNGEAVRLAFPFAKFFNINEVPETQKLPGEGVVYEKLDGSLISCWVDTDGEIRCSTRGMLDNMKPVIGKATTYFEIGENPIVKAFLSSIDRSVLESLVNESVTVMFELLGDKPASQCPDFEKCLGNPRPYLLARRIGDEQIEYIEHTGVPSPRKFSYKADELLEIVKELKDMEGFVIYYPGMKYRQVFPWWDYLVKVKSYQYVLKSQILFGYGEGLNYRNLAKLIIASEAPDDAISLFPEERDFILRVWEAWSRLKEEFEKLASEASEKTLKMMRAQNMKWLADIVVRYSNEGIEPLKQFILDGLPRSRDAIIQYLERVWKRIVEARSITGSRQSSVPITN